MIIVAIIVIIVLLKPVFAIIAIAPVTIEQQQHELHNLAYLFTQMPMKG